MQVLGALGIVIGYILLAFGLIISVGYGIYEWQEHPFNVAAWSGFVMYLKCLGGGIVSLVVGYALVVMGK